ncbi:MAG: amidohydrolase, partial [Chloroflexi bacterium]|nr:amidohydrolase [Chloroflexota bacterium]
VIEDGAVLIDGGHIAAVGHDAELASAQADVVVDGQRRKLVMPGMTNLHMHSGLIRGLAEDLPLWEWLDQHVDPKHRALLPDDTYHASRLCYAENLRAGITSVLDMYRHPWLAAQACDEIGIRSTLAPYVADQPPYTYFEAPDDNVRAIKELHGTAGRRLQVWFGLEHLWYCTPRAYELACDMRREYGVGIHTHCGETYVEVERCLKDYGKRPVAVLGDLGILGRKTVLAHCVWLNQAEIQQLFESETAASHNPASNMKLASGPAPLVQMLDRGVTVGLGSDGIKENNRIDLFQEMKLASLLARVTRLDALRPRAGELVRMATINGARALGLDSETGSIEPGKSADLAILALDDLHWSPVLEGEWTNVLANLVYSATPSDVETVLVEGRPVVWQRELQTADEEVLRSKHREVTEALLERRRQYVPA